MRVVKLAPSLRHPDHFPGVIGLGVDPDTRAPACAAVWVPKTGRPMLLGFDVAKRVANEVKSIEAVIFSCREVGDLVRGVLRAAVEYLNDQEVFGLPVTLAVEGQMIYPRDKAKSSDILNLANVTGAALGADIGYAFRLRPLPAEWKGNVPKETSQARTFKELGIPCKVVRSGRDAWCVPASGLGGFSRDAWADLADAIGIALWAAKVTSA